jgi:hypothetical protein
MNIEFACKCLHSRFRAIKPADRDINPLDWWKIHEKEFPTLALFMKSNAAFQPTSLASERLFNKDKMLYGTTRTQLTETHGEDFLPARLPQQAQLSRPVPALP